MKKRSVGEGYGIPYWNQLTRRGMRGVKGEPLPRDWEGRDLFMNLSTEHLHALRHKASADSFKVGKTPGVL